MAINKLKLEIVTPQRVFYKGDVEIVILRTCDGEEGFMADHSHVMKLLEVAGEVKIKDSGNQDFKIAALSGGFLKMRDNTIQVFADSAEWPDEIDIERAQAAQHRAEERLEHHEVDLDVARAKTAMAKALNRMKVKEHGLNHIK